MGTTSAKLKLTWLGWRTISAVLVALCTFASPCAYAQPQRVTVSALASRTDVLPGDQVAIAVVFEHEPGWHIHTSKPVIPASWGDFPAIATTISVSAVRGVTSGTPQWPRTEELKLDLAGTGKPEPYLVYAGTAIAFLPVIVEPNAAPGQLSIKVTVTYQACNDRTCLLEQQDELEVVLTVLAPGSARGAENQPERFKDLDRSVFSTVGRASDAAFNVFGKQFTIGSNSLAQLAVILLLAALGGFILNFTPCVLPIIPIKVMGLSAVAGNRPRLLLLGTVSSLGTIAFWLGIGIAMATITAFKAINQLFQFPAFPISVGVFILVMGLGMLGLFTIRLPQAVYAVDADKGSIGGSFLFGILTAVLSTPCTAPFMASAAAWAALQPAGLTLSVFTAIGVGMAIPYFLLCAFPALIEKVPRTGPASELVKQVMGLLMFAVAVFFLGTGLDPLLRQPVDPAIRWFWWVIAAIVCAAMAWMIFRTVAITKSAWRRVFYGGAGIALSTVMVFAAIRITDRGPINWIAYTPERFAEARAAKRVVVMDFTAEWCLNCKLLEGGVLHQPSVYALLNGPGVAAFRVDLTGNNKPGQDMLQELKWVGIPLLAIWGPGLPEPLKFDTYTPETVRNAIAVAGGGASAATNRADTPTGNGPPIGTGSQPPGAR